ncbi:MULTISPECIES: SDR family NAD(P)-dependent oxidoreductase [unclassified Rhodococcus (in: high G+C Gram-positive bacteria)]|uniref:SDR family NAD(P)-dependent oxidoreductase n=1 Tax=unclassified Rhodococcus (in: high G+C Gram-positive bacteria) TaxID=192944 RepID=UPI00202DE030|nr:MULTISPECIES: SDR family NAD(P)-dependent oxidoreductase [unclassified Rhodococcus (in: high G+C Gram-positive bacteria)]MDI9948068.1 SDR family NAD(P)-dependent oxidoreductase [Rhodococcus sp. IEGM 1305]
MSQHVSPEAPGSSSARHEEASRSSAAAGELDGIVVAVFGAGSRADSLSNGQAAALTFARAGAAVACIDVDGHAADVVTQQIIDEGGTALSVQADVTSEDDVVRAYSAMAAEWEPPLAVHNNVGVTIPGEIVDLDRAGWDKGMALNATSCYLTIRHALPHMLARGKGSIVNVSSLASIRDTGYVYPVYNASKAAVNQLTISLALTYAKRGIRANAILPGLIDTPIGRQARGPEVDLDKELAARHAASPTGQMGTPWDVANAALFLMSDRAAYVNGVLLPIDGGLSARCI